MKNKSHLWVTFKWSSIDKALLPAFKRYLGRCFHLHKSALLLISGAKIGIFS